MAVAALSTAGFSQYIAASSNLSASQKAFQSLEQSLAAGDLTTAQTAFTTYQQLNQDLATATTGSSSTTQFSTDLTALGTAIGSGNLATAQSAFATLQSDLKAAPSQAVTNAESAASQTVQWIDDLLNLSSSSSSTSTSVDPTTAILDSAYGRSTSTATDPTASLLDSAYGTTSAGNDPTTSGPPQESSSTGAVSAGNNGSSATVNAYA